MHEGKFTEQIVEAILTRVKDQPVLEGQTIRVRVGEIFHLHPDAVLLHYELLTKDTPLAGIPIDLSEEPVSVHCNDCGQDGPVEDHHLLLCTHCGSRQVTVTAGQTICVEIQ